MTTMHLFATLTDEALLVSLHTLMSQERRATAELVAALAEFDARRLYLSAGCSSLFTYCTQVLHLSESAAYKRIEAARATRRFQEILERLTDGRLTLSTVVLLGRAFTEENRADLLDAAMYKSKREVEGLVSRVRPLPPVPATVRKLPAKLESSQPPATARLEAGQEIAPQGTSSSCPEQTRSAAALSAPHRPVVQPLAPEIFKVQFTLSRDGHDNLRRAQDLLRHVVPNGDVAAVFERALGMLVENLEKRKLAATSKPRQGSPGTRRSRHIPAGVKREVWRRDGGQCAFVGSCGRCTERGLLEFHHVMPYADGGLATVENLQLRCAAHNAYEAALWSGADVARERAPAGWL